MPTTSTPRTDRGAHARRGLLVVMLAAATLGAGCTGEPDSSTAPATTAAAAAEIRSIGAQADSEPSPTTMTYFLVVSGKNDLHVEPTTVSIEQTPVDALDRARLSITSLLIASANDTPAFFRPDLTSTVPLGTNLNAISVADGIITLDLTGDIRTSAGSSSEERALAQQLAHTALVDPAFRAIRLLVDGAPVTALWGHLDWSVPITADPLARAPVTIVEPAPATTASGPGRKSMSVIGVTNTPQATVLLRLEDENGTVLAESSIVSGPEGPDAGRWAVDVFVPAAGTWVIVAATPSSTESGTTAVFETRRSFAFTD